MSIGAKSPDRATNQKVARSSRAGRTLKSILYGRSPTCRFSFVTILLRIARSHSRDGVALAGIARVHIAHRGRDRCVPHQLTDLNHIGAGCREARFSYLNWAALFVGAVLLVIAAFAVQRSRPSNADFNVDSGA
jgi:hypothetical protein